MVIIGSLGLMFLMYVFSSIVLPFPTAQVRNHHGKLIWLSNVAHTTVETVPLMFLFGCDCAFHQPALISGSFAERVEFKAWLMFMILFSIFVYAPIAHLTWHPEGLLHKWGKSVPLSVWSRMSLTP